MLAFSSLAKFRQQRKGFVQTFSSLVIRLKGDRTLISSGGETGSC
jgi:hypothetical protein